MPISSNFSGHWHQRQLSKRKEHSAALQSVSFLPPPVCTMLLGLSSNTLFWQYNRAGMAKVSWSTSTQSWKSWKWQKLKSVHSFIRGMLEMLHILLSDIPSPCCGINYECPEKISFLGVCKPGPWLAITWSRAAADRPDTEKILHLTVLELQRTILVANSAQHI